jgi:hypothetical protein
MPNCALSSSISVVKCLSKYMFRKNVFLLAYWSTWGRYTLISLSISPISLLNISKFSGPKKALSAVEGSPS